MAAAARGLTPADLSTIRDALASGRKPKVVFTSAAGQMAGNAGSVVELTDPAGSDEWIVVQFGRDQLPFSPADLAIPVRGAAGKPAAAARDTRKRPVVEAAPGPPLLEPAPAPRKPTSAARSGPTPRPAAEAAAPKRAGTASRTSGTDESSAVSHGANGSIRTGGSNGTPIGSGGVNGATSPNGAGALNGGALNGGALNGGAVNGGGVRPAKVAKSKPPASLVVTLSYVDREWMIAATQGSKSLAKPYVIKPTEALRMVALIDVPGVHDAVESIIAAERAEAEHRAQRLREELAEIESRLAELTDRP